MTFDDIPRLVEQCIEAHKAFREGFREQVTGSAPDTKRPNDLQFMVWWAQMTMQRYPPQPWVSPEGAVVIASPWELALPYVEGGKAELERWQRIVNKALGDVA